MAANVYSLIIALLLCLFWLMVLWDRWQHAQLDRSAAPAIRHRLLKPRTPDDCPARRRQVVRPALSFGAPPAVRPWKDFKSPRGAPRRIVTDGFACPNYTCRYHGITDAQVHALAGDGTHGKHERIQIFRCQA